MAQILLGVIESRSNIQHFIDWVEVVSEVNNYYSIAIYRQALQIPPQAIIDNTTFGVAVMALVDKSRLATQFPQPFALMRDFFDRALEASLSQAKGENRSPSVLWGPFKVSESC